MKKQTLEEVALSFLPSSEVEHDTDFIIGFINGAKWQQKRSYSEEDVRKAILFGQGMELWKEEFQINGFIQSLKQKHELNKSE